MEAFREGTLIVWKFFSVRDLKCAVWHWGRRGIGALFGVLE